MTDYIPKFAKPEPMKDKHKRTRKPQPKVTDKERDIQAWAEQLLAVHDVPFIRLPDSLLKGFFNADSVNIWTKRNASNYLAGLPDLILFNPDKGTYKAIEIKTEKGRLSPKQRAWQEKLNTVVTMGWQQTKDEIMKFINKEQN